MVGGPHGSCLRLIQFSAGQSGSLNSSDARHNLRLLIPNSARIRLISSSLALRHSVVADTSSGKSLMLADGPDCALALISCTSSLRVCISKSTHCLYILGLA